MRRSGPPSTRSRYQSPATRPGLRTAFMSPPSVTGFSGLPDDTPNVAGKVSAAAAIGCGCLLWILRTAFLLSLGALDRLELEAMRIRILGSGFMAGEHRTILGRGGH